MIQATGFKHVTVEGMQALVDLLTNEGSIALVCDRSNKDLASTLMQAADFNRMEHCKRRTNSDTELEDMLTEVHEELLDALFGIQFAFVQDLDHVSCPISGRTISGLEWNFGEVLVLNTLDQVAAYVIKHIADVDEIFVKLVADITADESSDCQEPQTLEFRLTGAGDHQVLTDVSEALLKWGYKIHYVIDEPIFLKRF